MSEEDSVCIPETDGAAKDRKVLVSGSGGECGALMLEIPGGFVLGKSVGMRGGVSIVLLIKELASAMGSLICFMIMVIDIILTRQSG